MIALKNKIDSLQPRERALVLGGGSVLLVALLYAYLWLPLHQQRQKLQDMLPRLRAQAAALQTARTEVLALKAQVGSVSRANQPLRAALESSAAGLGIKIQRLDVTGETSATLILEGVAFDTWLRWLDGLQMQSGLRLVSGEISSTSQTGLVNIQATLSSE